MKARSYAYLINKAGLGGRAIILPGVNTTVPLTADFIVYTLKTFKESRGHCGDNLAFAIEVMLKELLRLKNGPK